MITSCLFPVAFFGLNIFMSNFSISVLSVVGARMRCRFTDADVAFFFMSLFFDTFLLRSLIRRSNLCWDFLTQSAADWHFVTFIIIAIIIIFFFIERGAVEENSPLRGVVRSRASMSDVFTILGGYL